MGGLGDLLKAQMATKLSEAKGEPIEKGAAARSSGGKVQDRASQGMVNAASAMFRNALSKKPEGGEVEKSKPAPAPAPTPTVVIKNGDLEKLERELLIGTLDSIMKNSKTLSKQVVGGLELLRDAVKEELA